MTVDAMTRTQLPFVSVIMPVRNEASFIDRSLGAVLSQDYPGDRMEVLVVDGMSTDNTRDIVGGLAQRALSTEAAVDMPSLRLLENPRKIVPTAFNIGLLHARGDVIVRVDGHAVIATDYIQRCVAHLSECDVACVGGPIDTIARTALGQSIAVAMSSPFGVGGVAFRTAPNQRMEVDTVAFGAYRRSVFDRYGCLDEEMVRNQDDEYNYRLRKMGERILLAPDIRSTYYSRSSLSSLWKQYFQYGYWKVRVMQKHPRQMRLRQFIPPAFVAALLGSAILAFMLPYGWALALLVIGAYSLANLSASIHVAVQQGWRHLPTLPLIYAILHLSYGLGFLTGLVKFSTRWGDIRDQTPPREGDSR